MIRTVTTASRYLAANSWPGNTPWVDNPQPLTGMVRYTNSRLEVFDGTNWAIIGDGGATVNLTPEAEALLDWAREKRQQEENLKARLEQHPGLKEAYEKFLIMDALTLEDKKENK